ncbi:hypothetical protein [Bacillus sp. T3]|uniref:hypothetical protein n=1 Tax=Bacillus sp. T3 TaxID=467262 RepID=UPI00298279C9|nr:hypothetical protein [Bacillus sp. T3]
MKEVISLPAAQTQDIIKKYLVHAHPHPRKYKEAKYMALRKAGGVMDSLYSVECAFVLKPESIELEKDISFLNDKWKDRLLGYIHERKRTFGFGEKEEYKFYLLKVEHFLNHLPKPKEKNFLSHTYYTLNELMNGKKEVSREAEIKKAKG